MTVGTDAWKRARVRHACHIRKSRGARQDTRKQPGVGAAELAEVRPGEMVQFGTLTATTLSSSPVGSIAFPSLTYPTPIRLRCLPTIANASSMQWSRVKADAILTGSANAPSAPQRGMSVEEAKALLERWREQETREEG